MRVFDRRLLLVGAGAAIAAAGVASCDSSPTALTPPVVTGTVTDSSFRSAARLGISVGYQVILPPGHSTGAGLPVCLLLHGYGDDHRAAVRLLRVDQALATVTQEGAPPIALVTVDGGFDTYWHRRVSGDDPQQMILDELLPLLASAGMKTQRFALLGWSMGAYGSLLLAETVGRNRVAFVAADSPALWLTGGETPNGAFDNAEDFARNNVFNGRPRLAGIPVRVMCGRSDPFIGATREFVKGVPDLVAVDYPAGGHDPKLWAGSAVAQLTPLAHALG